MSKTKVVKKPGRRKVKAASKTMRSKKSASARSSVDIKPWPHENEFRNRPATYGVVKEVRGELLHEIGALRSETVAGFDRVDARFNKVDARFEQVDARFEQVDARFEQVDARFEQVDTRFNEVQAQINTLQAHMAELTASMHKVLAAVQEIKADQEHYTKQNEAVLDAYSIIREKMETNKKQLNEKVDRRLDAIENTVQQLARRVPLN